ncbi:MAG: ferredoxin reductase family protein [Chloroflexota bacterium]
MTTLTRPGRPPGPPPAAGPLAPARTRGRRRAHLLTPNDILVLIGASGVLTAGIWLRHGGVDQLGSPSGLMTGLGQLTALLGTWLALVGVLLMARVPWIDHVVGSDRLRAWHRWVGFGTLWLLVGHAVLTTAGWVMGPGADVIGDTIALWTTWEVLLAVVGLGLLTLVAVSSVKAARRRIGYETWYGLHLYAYLGIALAFVHEVTMGTDLVDDPVALGWWIGLYGVTFGLLLIHRVGAPIALTLRHRPRVVAVVPEANGVVSIHVGGRAMDRLDARAGQFFQVRFLSGGGWWRPHPFSISAAPDGRTLRFTIKDLGDDTHRMLTMPIGTPVFLEGPYGSFTADAVAGDRAVLLAGGIGVTPLRAILDELPPETRTTLLFRASDWSDIAFRDELVAIARARRIDVRFLVGRRGTPEMPVDPLSPEWLSRLVPDLRQADVLVCGSPSFTDRVLTTLRALEVPKDHIHAERFGA